MGTVREELAAELHRYSVTCAWWSALADQAERTQEPESVTDCEHYDRKMQEHAGVFAHLAAVYLAHGADAPAYPGAGLLAEREDAEASALRLTGSEADTLRTVLNSHHFEGLERVRDSLRAEPLGAPNPAHSELPELPSTHYYGDGHDHGPTPAASELPTIGG